MPQTFGIDIQPIGVAKYTQEKLNPLDSADLARFFNMGQQKKEADQKDAVLKSQALIQTNTLLKDLEMLPKQSKYYEEQLSPVYTALQKGVKTPEEALEVQSKLLGILSNPQTMQYMKETKTFKDHQKFLEDNFTKMGVEDRKRYGEDLQLRATDPSQSVFDFNPSSYLGISGDEKVQNEQLKGLQNENSLFEVKSAIQNQISVGNAIENQKKQLELDTYTKGYERRSAILDDPTTPTYIKDGLSQLTDPSELSVWTSTYRANKEKIDSGEIDGNAWSELLKIARTGLEGKFAPGNRNTNIYGGAFQSSGNKDVDEVLIGDAVYQSPITGNIQKISDLIDKQGNLDGEALATQGGEYLSNITTFDDQGNPVFFAPRLDNNQLGKQGNSVADQSAWYGANSYGDYLDNIPVFGNDLKPLPNQKAYNLIADYDEANITEGTDAKKTMQINWTSKATSPKPIYGNFVSQAQGAEKQLPFQMGYYRTNNPQILNKYYQNNKDKGEAWYRNHVGVRNTPDGPEFIIKDVVWDLTAQSKSANIEKNASIAKFIRDYHSGKKVINNVQPSPTPKPNAPKVPINKKVLKADQKARIEENIRLYPELIDAYSNLPNARETIESIAALDPKILGYLDSIVNIADPNDLVLLEGISDAADDLRDYDSSHNKGLGIDLTGASGAINKGISLFERILANQNDFDLSILAEGRNEQQAVNIASAYGLNNKNVKWDVKHHPDTAPHLHISFIPKRKPTAIDKAMTTNPKTVTDTAGMGAINLNR